MSLLIDQLALWLQAQGEGTVGTSLFKLSRPAAPVTCVTLYATGGYPPDKYTGREFPTLQIVCRAGTPNGALQKAYAIWNRLAGKQCLDLGNGIYANVVEALNSPVSLGEEGTSSVPAYLAAFNLRFDLKRPSN